MAGISANRARGLTKTEIIEELSKRKKGSGKKNPTATLGKMLRRTGKTAQRVGDLYGVTNPGITIGTGRNGLHPTGDLNDTVRSNGRTIPLRHPITGVSTPNDKVMLDVVGTLTGTVGNFGGLPDTFGGRARGALAKVGYNLRSSFTPGGGFATTWWPVVLGPVAGRITRTALDTAAGLARELGRLAPKRS